MRVIMTGGGTGGHIYPALALARYIKKNNPGSKIIFVGAKGGMEEKIVPPSGFPLETLNIKGFPRRLTPELLKNMFLLGKSCSQAGKIIKEFRPHWVVGTGGYVAAPTVLAAFGQRKKVILHEQNVIPGITNRMLALWAFKVCLSFEASRKYFLRRSNLVVTGNPRASEVIKLDKTAARNILGMEKDLPLLLAVGGSRGAEKINLVMMEFLLRSSANKNFQILYITGEGYYQQVMERLRRGRVFEIYGPRLQVRPYQQEMPLAMAAADLIITRAGATTLSEITALGLPAIIIPSPNVVHNHQYHNARELARRGAAVMIEEENLNGEELQRKVFRLIGNPAELARMIRHSKEMGFPDAAANIYKIMSSR